MSLLSVPGVLFTPSATKVPTPQNYLGADDYDFLNQYLPDTYAKQFNRFGTQDVCGMLEAMGKEMPLVADNVKWTEEGRLTQLGTGVTRSGNDFTLAGHTFRANETIIVRNDDGSVLRQGLITAVTSTTFTALCGNAAGWTAVGTTALTVYADSNEFKKGTDGMQESLNSQYDNFENNPVNIKETIKENGSNLTNITWIEIEGKNGEKGNVWYFKNYADTEKRFKNAIETKLIRGEKWAGDLAAAGYQGTQGMLSAFAEGNIFGGLPTALEDFDELIERSNAQGMLSDNIMYGTSTLNLGIDDMLRNQNEGSMGWGSFNNDKQMALNLGFSGFKRGGYEFAYSRWRYLDNPTTEGSIVGTSKVHGVMFASGSKKVYDVIKGEAAEQPMLHVRYKAKGKENRKYKMSVRDFDSGTSAGNDSLTVDFLTERCLVTVGRNNTFLFKG